MVNIDKDVCVIGSGFGGGVATLRAAQSGRSVVTLEAGDRWDGGPGSKQFQQTLGDFGYWLDLFQITVGVDFAAGAGHAVVTGKGLGGGSLIYSMVSLRAPSFVFDDPVWPEEVTRQTLDPYYEKAEEQLQITQLQWTGGPGEDWKVVSKRDGAFADACRQAGVSCDPVPVAVNNSCGNIGWCTPGCVRGAKNSTDRMYIGPAEAVGATVVTGAKVDTVVPNGSGRRWRINYVQGGATHTATADTVVIGAGAVGSPTILMKSAGSLPGGISSQVGRNLSRGGDVILFGVLPDDVGDLEPLETYTGKIIGVCSFEYMFEPPPGFGSDWAPFCLQPMMVLPPVAAVMVADPDGQTAAGDMRLFGTGPKHIMGKWGSRLLQIGAMGVDGMDGQVRLVGGVPTVRFSTSAQTQKFRDGCKAGFRHIIESAGGQMLPTWDEMRNDSFSIHPLGSCRMASSPAQGALRHDCAVWKQDGSGVHEGLHVMDTSTFSSPIGVNTSLTAAAVAERACDLIF